jgi:cleavage and polyadenylation specificity factor subunit 3
VTSNAHSHVHEHVHPHADSESDLERVQRLAMFLESHFGEVHMNVPEPEKVTKTVKMKRPLSPCY